MKKGCLEAVEALLVLKGQIDMNLGGGSHRQTPLHLAASNSHYRIVNHLLSSQADLFARNAENKMPLTLIQNNMLMIKIIKKAMIATAKELFEEFAKRPREHHLINF